MRAPQHPLFFWKSRKVDQMRDCMTLELVRLQNNSPDMIIISLTYMACLSACESEGRLIDFVENLALESNTKCTVPKGSISLAFISSKLSGIIVFYSEEPIITGNYT